MSAERNSDPGWERVGRPKFQMQCLRCDQMADALVTGTCMECWALIDAGKKVVRGGRLADPEPPQRSTVRKFNWGV